MVSEDKVNSDLNSLASLFSSYNVAFNNISSSWNGFSYEKLVKAAQDFSDEYYTSIKKQMEAFGSACGLYARYEVAKSNKEIALKNYNQAIAKNDNYKAAEFKKQSNEFAEKMSNYKKKIEKYLLTASGFKLDATNYYGSDAVVAPPKPTVPKTQPKTQPGTGSGTGGNVPISYPEPNPPSTDVQKIIQKAINIGISIANDNTHGYSQQTRWGNPNYDCSSLVITCYDRAGLPVRKAGAGYTGNMRYAFTKCGFIWIRGNPSVANLQPGDVLLDEDRHTEMYIGNGMNVGAHSNYDKRDGDSSGKEISVSKYNSGPWDGILRYVGKK